MLQLVRQAPLGLVLLVVMFGPYALFHLIFQETVTVRYALRPGLAAYAVAENLFDAQYQEVLGYPALSRSIRAGVSFRTGAAQ